MILSQQQVDDVELFVSNFTLMIEMTFSSKTLVVISRQILIYGGILTIVLGMFGSLMIILIFSPNKLNETPCSTYIIVNAILSFLYLPLYYLPTIITYGFEIDVVILNDMFCKFFMSYGIFSVTSTFLLDCFISFDRYAISSQSASVRALSSKKVARVLVIIGLFCSCCLTGLPTAILFEIIEFNHNRITSCSSKSTEYLSFLAIIYFPVLEGILPIILIILFWYLTRKQIRSLNNEQFIKRFDRQISRMCLFQILASCIASVPYAITTLYRFLTMNALRTEDQQNLVLFFRFLSIWLFHTQYAADFYIYMALSSEIRGRVKKYVCPRPRHWINRVSIA